MSSSYIGLGVTAVRDFPLTDADAIRAAAEPFRDQIIERLDDMDPAGYIENTETDPIDLIVEGVLWLRSHDGANAWEIPGTNLEFVTAGGETFGDSPFEDYDAVIITSEAAHYLPELGKVLGVFGGGIRLGFRPANN